MEYLEFKKEKPLNLLPGGFRRAKPAVNFRCMPVPLLKRRAAAASRKDPKVDSQLLLAELEQLPHGARQRRLVELGRDPSFAPLGERWARAGTYLRSLALMALHGSRDSARLLPYLHDPSTHLRRQAVRMLALFGSDEQIRQQLPLLSPRQARGLLTLLIVHHRRELVDSLPTPGSTHLLSAPQPQSMEGASLDDWGRLAQRHPSLARTWLSARIEAAAPDDGLVRYHTNHVLSRLAKFAPADALQLLEVALRRGLPLPQLQWMPVYGRLPQPTFDLVVRHSEKQRLALPPLSIRRLRPDQQHDALERGWLASPLLWLPRQSAERRQAAYLQVGEEWRDTRGFLTPELIEQLDADSRSREARRVLLQETHHLEPAVRLAYLHLLPGEAAEAELTTALGDPEPSIRSAAVRALVRSSLFAPERLPQVLETLTRRANEQDPVRLSFLQALSELPPGRWQAPHFKAMSQLVKDALAAADLSVGSGAALQRWLGRILPHQPAWAARWLAEAVARLGYLNPAALSYGVPEAALKTLGEEMIPRLEHWKPQERHARIYDFARALGRRARFWPRLLELIASITHDSRGSEAGAALSVLASCYREAVPEVVPGLLAADPSWLLHPVVLAWVHRQRQDLLNPYLAHPRLQGRFASGEGYTILPLNHGFWRWTLEQQRGFAELVETLTTDPDRDQPAVFRAIEVLAQLPALPPRRLIELANDPRPPVRDVALRALARLDGEGGLPELLVALGDDRARIAIYSLRGRLLRMPAARALEILSNVSSPKVTVNKEVLRLLGDLPEAQGLDELLRREPEITHRDERVALLRAFWSHQEDPRVPPLLLAAAADPDPAVAASLADAPIDRLSSTALGAWTELLATLLRHPSTRVQSAALGRLSSRPWSDPEGRLQPPLAALLRHANGSLFAQAVGAFWQGGARGWTEVFPDLLPRRQELEVFVRSLGDYARMRRSRLVGLARDVAEGLATDPHTVALRLTLLASVATLPELLDAVELAVGADRYGIDSLEAARAALAAHEPRPTLSTYTEITERWSRSADARLRRLALDAMLAFTRARGWDAATRAQLDLFRQDEEPLVATRAQFTFPPEPQAAG